MVPMSPLPPFAVQAADPCPAHAELALALAAEFEPVPLDRARAELDGFAAELAPARGESPRRQLAACAETAAARFDAGESPGALDDLLLHRVLGGRAGHPLALAIVVAEAGRRAGISLGVLGGADGWFVAHTALPEPWVLDPGGPGELTDLAGREGQFAWRCAHQTSAGLLHAIGRRAGRIGHVAWEVRAAELRLVLFADPSGRAEAGRELARVKARLN